MVLDFRRPVRLAAAAALMLGLAACASGPAKPRPMAPPPPSPEEALSKYRSELNSDEQMTGYATPEQVEAFRQYTTDLLGPKAIDAFELFIFINKAGEGPTAQHAFLFGKDGSGQLEYLDTWLVSTGREQQEVSPKGASKFTTTPPGIFQFDVSRFVRLHKSNAWEADMPWAMFLRTRNNNPTTGIALHAALDKYVHNLGQRASAGCIRLLPSNAEKLYKLLQTKYAGTVPNTSSTASLDISVGSSKTKGAKALLLIQDVDGDDIVARYGGGSPSAALN
jgi:hypothetical protein